MHRCSWIAVLGWVLTGPGERVLRAEPPTPPAADADESGHAPTSKFDRIQEFLEAAKHLDAADDVELARQVRRQATRLLLEESARLAQEQRRLESLSVGLEPAQFIIQAHVAESQHLGRNELMRAVREGGGTTVDSDSIDTKSPGIAAILGPSIDASEVLHTLSTIDKDLQIVSRPQLVALDGMPAEFQIGESRRVIRSVNVSDRGVAVPEYAYEDVGIRISVTPTLASDNCIQLDLTAEKSEFLEQETTVFTDPASGKSMTTPVKDITSAQASAKVPEGRVLFLVLDLQTHSGNAESGDSSICRTLLFMIQPKKVIHQPKIVIEQE